MRPKAVIFDIYKTMLAVAPPPADAATRWDSAWRATLGTPPRLSLDQFMAECRQLVLIEHTTARAQGIPFPEVHWPDIVIRVLPEFARMPAALRLTSPVFGADLSHTVSLIPGVADTLRVAREKSLLLGLASNCQPYSLRELDDALAGTGVTRDLFDPALTFLSFENGFSKPDPHVFRLLTARLRARCISAAEILMVGDREDNDLAPARAQGWQTFAIAAEPAASWAHLRETLAAF